MFCFFINNTLLSVRAAGYRVVLYRLPVLEV